MKAKYINLGVAGVCMVVLSLLFTNATSSSRFVAAPGMKKSDVCGTSFVRNGSLVASYPKELSAGTASSPISWGGVDSTGTYNPFLGEPHLFGYSPTFTPGRVSFAPNGRPLILARPNIDRSLLGPRDAQLSLQILNDNGSWKQIDIGAIAQAAIANSLGVTWGGLIYTGQFADTQVVFDQSCHVYIALQTAGSLTQDGLGFKGLGYHVLLHSPDGGENWDAYKLENPRRLDGTTYFAPSNFRVGLESPARGLTLADSPVISFSQSYAEGTLDTYKNLLATVPRKNLDGTLTLPTPTLLSSRTLYTATHSGGENRIVSAGGKIFVAFAGSDKACINAGATSERCGTPARIMTLTRDLQRIEGPLALGIAFNGPAKLDLNPDDKVDDHNQPVLALGADGTIHYVISGHHSWLKYLKSKTKYSIGTASDWTTMPSPGVVGGQTYIDESGKSVVLPDIADQYTYASLKLDQYDNPIVIARWEGLNNTYRLVQTIYSSTALKWSTQQTLLKPGRSGYGVWWHKVSLDGRGRQYVTTSYFPNILSVTEFDQYLGAWSPYWDRMHIDYLKEQNCTPTHYGSSTEPDRCPTTIPATAPSLLVNQGFNKRFNLGTTRTFFD